MTDSPQYSQICPFLLRTVRSIPEIPSDGICAACLPDSEPIIYHVFLLV